MRDILSFRCTRWLSGLVIIASTAAPAAAQVAGRNVNMVTGGTFPGGDPFLQKQNEPSIAISTRNPCHLLAGANDYRAVELPGLPDDHEIGDAWLGWYESTDCGQTWYSTLVPGYLQDKSAEGLASPVKGLSAGADPVVRSGAAGTFYYLFIAFNRGSNVGKLGLARAIDHNDRETFIDPNAKPISPDGAVNPRRALSPIQYVGTTELARGSAGQFIDKPSLAVFPAASGSCTMNGETVPATNVYVAWTEFVGNSPENLRSKVYFARSADCGRTLAGPATKLSEGYPIGQGTAIAVNPRNPNEIVVVWRQIRTSRIADALLYARSLDGGRSFTKAMFIPGFGEGVFAPFDQNTTSKSRGHLTTTFRTVAYPTLAYADDGFLYLAIAQVPGPPSGQLGGEQARITLTRFDGVGWEPPQPLAVSGAPAADGQQFMPALAYAAGKLQLVWYDVRFDEAELTGDRLIDDEKALSPTGPRRRRTIDVLGAQATLPSSVFPPQFHAYGVSQPDYNDPSPTTGPPPLRGPRVSQYLTGDRDPLTDNKGARQLLFNRGGLLLYGGGTIPFIGDYIDVAPIPFVFDGSNWVFNGLQNAGTPSLQVFQTAWTDNRDAHVSRATIIPGTNPPQLAYVKPAVLPAGMTIADGPCAVSGLDNTRTRDANVYTSRITQDFSLTAPGNSKPNTPGVIRAFALQLTNNRELTPSPGETATTYRLTLPQSARASFSRHSFVINGALCADSSTPPVREIDVDILPRSSAARTVYVPCGASYGPVVVTATDLDSGATASVLLNADPSTPGTRGPGGSPLGPESHNPDAENPDAENPDAENPDAENPDAENPDAENPDAENPDAENPDAENPDAENPDAENPDAENPDAENANFQDISTDVTNDGDTTSAYQAQVQTTADTTGYQFLLMGRRVYATPTSINCALVQKRNNQTLFAIPLDGSDLDGQFNDENDADQEHPTFLVRPGESIRITLRIVYNRNTTSAFCSADESDPDWCFNKIVIKTKAQAPNTGELEPREDAVGTLPGPDLTFDGAFAPSASVAGLGGIVDLGSATIRNAGNESAPAPFSWRTFIASETTGLVFADLIGSSGEPLAPGGEIPAGPVRLVVPTCCWGSEFSVPAGVYDVGLIADADDEVEETNEGNNVLSAGAITVLPYRATVNTPTSTTAGFPFSVNVPLTEPSGGSDVYTVLLSLEQIDGTGTLTADDLSVETVEGLASFTNVRISAPGTYRLIAAVQVGDDALRFQSSVITVVPFIGDDH